MDIPSGMLLTPINLKGWNNFCIRDRVSDACGLPVDFENDANAAAYGEFWVGSGREFQSMALLTLGTGIGCGIIIGDLVLQGAHSHGGENGHGVIDCREDARLCSCGARGHLEAYASATAVIRRAEELLEPGAHEFALAERIAGGEELTPKLIAEEAERGDELSNGDHSRDGAIPGRRRGQPDAHHRSGGRAPGRGDDLRRPRARTGTPVPGHGPRRSATNRSSHPGQEDRDRLRQPRRRCRLHRRRRRGPAGISEAWPVDARAL